VADQAGDRYTSAMAKKAEKKEACEAAGGASEKPPAFETALAELEEIVRQLEAGEKSLNESLKLYERGVAALRSCHQLLDQAEQRIRKLVAGPGGEPLVQEVKLSPTRAPEAEEAADAGEAAVSEAGGAPARKPRGATRAAPPKPPTGEQGGGGEGTSRKGESLFGGA
jgi:exodeoxyribonuclease VII small subunit